MASNMNVSVTLRLVDQFTSGVRGLLQSVQQLRQSLQALNRQSATSGWSAQLNRVRGQLNGLRREVDNATSGFQRLGRAMGVPAGGGFAASQVSGMRQLLQLQQRALTNQRQLASGGGGGRGPTFQGGGWWNNGRGFHPNASLVDRAQYRFVNMGERALAEGFLDLDRARTRLGILATPLPGQQAILQQRDVADAEAAASAYTSRPLKISPA